MLFERFDQRGFRESRWRLGEVLFASKFHKRDGVAFLHRRQDVIRVVRLRVVGAFLVDRDIARLHQRRAVGPQHVPLRTVGPGKHVDRDRIENRMAHLRCDGALPDERVEPVEVVVDLAFNQPGGDGSGSRANGFVRFLRILRLCLVNTRLVCDLILAIQLRRDLANLLDCLFGQRDRVRTHVRDQTHAAFADVDTFI